MIQTILANLNRVRESKALIHHITNDVTVNDCANATLQIGALPVMAHALEESAEMQLISDALVLNIGTLTPDLVDAMIAAGQAANHAGHPVVFDPVGVGATGLRTRSALRILEQVRVDVIKGNQAEIAVLGGLNAVVRGVESGAVDGNVLEAARALAGKHQAVVAVTGPEDLVVSAYRAAQIRNGHSSMGSVCGTGCMGASLIGAFAAGSADWFEAAVSALTCFGAAGERAAEALPDGPMAYKIALLDALYRLTGDDVAQLARVEVMEWES